MHQKQPSEVFRFRSVLGHVVNLQWWGHPCRNVISIKMHSSSFVWMPQEVFPCHLSAFLGHLTMGWFMRDYFHGIVNVNIFIKGPDITTIVFCRFLQIQYLHNCNKKTMQNFCKKTKRKEKKQKRGYCLGFSSLLKKSCRNFGINRRLGEI